MTGQAPPQAAQEEQVSAELPYWANQDGLQPDPERPGYTLAGDQYKGNPQAKVVVVEFSDFQCPACQQHALEIQPEIDEALVDDGKIMWVFKHLPLQEHPQALVAAAAAECAAEQGEFWKMYHRLFEKVDVWAVENPEPALVSLAADIGLDAAAFSSCLDSCEPMERVIQDLYDSQGITRLTPTFIVLFEGKGRLMQGSMNAEQFIKILDALLQQ